MNKNTGKYGIRKCLQIVQEYSPISAFVIQLHTIISSITPTIQVLVEAYFLDTVIKVIQSGKNYASAISAVVALIVLLFYGFLSPVYIKLVEVNLENNLRKKFRTALLRKKSLLPYKYMENSKKLDLIERVTKEPEIQMKNIYMDTMGLQKLIIKTVGILIILISKMWWITLIITAVSIPLFRLSMKSGRANYEAGVEVTKVSRTYNYLRDILIDRSTAHERALFGYGNKVNKMWIAHYEKARKIQLNTEKKWFIKMKAGGVIAAIICIMVLFPLMYAAKVGTITIGLFISLVNAIFDLVQTMSWELTAQMDKLAKNKEYMREYGEFENLETETVSEDKQDESFHLDSVEFRKVSFRYPTGEDYVLKNVSFRIENGKHYSFVGKNGSGKTTITKLLTGLYTDYDGEILVNNKSLREYSRQELNRLYAVVFQDFAKYSISLRDNIAIGDVKNIEETDMERRIYDVIKLLDLEDVCKSKDGINMHLGKIRKDGVDLSGGQWQRIAMARGVINSAPLKILDEPTAALDPVSESNIYKKFEQISKDRTTIFISHRLGSTQLADKIFVLDNGTIAEEGDHDTLMNLNGLYYDMYNKQRSWYV